VAAGCAGAASQRRLSDFLDSADEVIEYTASANGCGLDVVQLGDREMSPSGHEHRIDDVSVVSGVPLIASELVRWTTDQRPITRRNVFFQTVLRTGSVTRSVSWRDTATQSSWPSRYREDT